MKTTYNESEVCALAAIALITIASCASPKPTIVDQARATHIQRMYVIAQIKDPAERARQEAIENYRYQKFLAGVAAIAGQMVAAQRRERAVAALEQIAQQQQQPIVAPQQPTRVPYVPTPELPPQFGTYPGSRLNPICVQVVPTPTPGAMFAPLPGY